MGILVLLRDLGDHRTSWRLHILNWDSTCPLELGDLLATKIVTLIWIVWILSKLKESTSGHFVRAIAILLVNPILEA